MNKGGSSQVFYDKSRKRWKKYRGLLILFFAVFLAVFGFAAKGLWEGVDTRGVIEKKNLSVSENQARTAPPQSDSASEKKEKVAAFFVNWDENSFSSLRENIDKIDLLMPEWLHLAPYEGELALNNGFAQDEVMEFIANSGFSPQIAPLVNNYNSHTGGWDSDRLISFIGSEKNRIKTANNLLNFVSSNDFSGVTVDFENVPREHQGNFQAFMEKLHSLFHEKGLDVYQAIPLSNFEYDATQISRYADYIILMAYDKNVVSVSNPGPIAPQEWILENYKKRLEQAPAEKYILALGNYGYDWKGQEPGGNSASFQQIMSLASRVSANPSLDPQSLNPTFKYTDSGGQDRTVWYLDSVSFYNQVKGVRDIEPPHGFALWRMGSEDSSVWSVIEDIGNFSYETLKRISHISSKNEVRYSGEGEVLKITQTPKEGKRKITFNRLEGLIKEEGMLSFPSPYVITRFGGDDKNKIAITFDDGPDSEYTPLVLDILKEHDVRATFFVVGATANSNIGLLKKVAREGHEIGNHTYTHPNISTISDKRIKLELDSTQKIIEGFTGEKSVLFRPPYAEDIAPSSVDQIRPLEVTDSRGYYTVSMNIDPKDWNMVESDLIAENVITGTVSGAGNIILLHDGGGKREKTVEALPIIISELKNRGYEFVTVSELAGITNVNEEKANPIKAAFLGFMNRSSFYAIKWGALSMAFLFSLGIILGLLKFFFIMFFSIVQWLYTRNAEHKNISLKYEPSVSVIIPAFNEEKVICKTIDAILSSAYQNYEIIVVDDGSDDRTYDVVMAEYGFHEKVSLYAKDNGGKATALNFGISKSSGEILITLDADTVFKKDTINKIVRRFIDAKVGAVAGNAKVGNRTNILTKWQALEYITSQNLDKRGFEVLNSVTVVPGAIGAWRREAVFEAGGFSSDTLAEDADLTFSVIRNGYKVVFDDEAIAYTEAPDEVGSFLKQRFRWMYGMLQTAWKHKDTLFRKKYGFIGFVSVPNVFIFQVFFPLISPLMDLALVFSVFWAGWEQVAGSAEFSAISTIQDVLLYYTLFLVVDLLTAAIPFALERKEDWKLIFWLPLQRFYYRQLMYYVAIKAVLNAVKGKAAGWNKLERKASVPSFNR